MKDGCIDYRKLRTFSTGKLYRAVTAYPSENNRRTSSGKFHQTGKRDSSRRRESQAPWTAGRGAGCSSRFRSLLRNVPDLPI
jgi:hypothetical protein